jgi:hypothetical protein
MKTFPLKENVSDKKNCPYFSYTAEYYLFLLSVKKRE